MNRALISITTSRKEALERIDEVSRHHKPGASLERGLLFLSCLDGPKILGEVLELLGILGGELEKAQPAGAACYYQRASLTRFPFS